MQWKLFAVGAVLAGLGTGGLIREEVQAVAVAERQAAQQYQVNMARLTPSQPQDWVRIIHDTVARGQFDRACWMLAEPLRPTFAAAHHAPDCVAAMTELGGQVRDRVTYADPQYDYRDVIQVQGDRASLDLCRVYWRGLLDRQPSQPGPLLGRFELQRVIPGNDQGYQAVAWEPCPSVDSAPTSTTAGTTGSPSSAAGTTQVPPPVTPTTTPDRLLLPSYPPAYPAVILTNVARRNTGICQYFTAAGQAAFAAMLGVAGCAEAVNVLADRVTDPNVYGKPQASSVATTTIGGGLQSAVDACHLEWLSSGGSPTPGPQLGHLDLVLQPAGGAGYLVDGVRAC